MNLQERRLLPPALAIAGLPRHRTSGAHQQQRWRLYPRKRPVESTNSFNNALRLSLL